MSPFQGGKFGSIIVIMRRKLRNTHKREYAVTPIYWKSFDWDTIKSNDRCSLNDTRRINGASSIIIEKHYGPTYEISIPEKLMRIIEDYVTDKIFQSDCD